METHISMATTIQQVAKVAGVSRSTANMILAGHDGKYASQTCVRVMEAAKQLNYRPNISARSLKNRRSYLIGAVFNKLNAPYLADFTAGFQAAVTSNKCAPIVLIVEDVESELEALQILSDRQVDGVLANPLPAPDDDRGLQRVRQMREAKVPVIEVFGRSLSPEIHSVNTDPYRAGFDATKCLIEQGCQSPLLYDPEQFSEDQPRTIWNWFGWDHARGYRDAMAEHGLEPNITYFEIDEVRNNPRHAVIDLFSQQQFDGFLSLSPVMLRETIFEINQSPDRVPEHFTVGGYADFMNNYPCCRSKVAVHLAIRESVEKATKQLFNVIKGQEAHDMLLGPKIQVIPTVPTHD